MPKYSKGGGLWNDLGHALESGGADIWGGLGGLVGLLRGDKDYGSKAEQDWYNDAIKSGIGIYDPKTFKDYTGPGAAPRLPSPVNAPAPDVTAPAPSPTPDSAGGVNSVTTADPWWKQTLATDPATLVQNIVDQMQVAKSVDSQIAAQKAGLSAAADTIRQLSAQQAAQADQARQNFQSQIGNVAQAAAQGQQQLAQTQQQQNQMLGAQQGTGAAQAPSLSQQQLAQAAALQGAVRTSQTQGGQGVLDAMQRAASQQDTITQGALASKAAQVDASRGAMIEDATRQARAQAQQIVAQQLAQARQAQMMDLYQTDPNLAMQMQGKALGTRLREQQQAKQGTVAAVGDASGATAQFNSYLNDARQQHNPNIDLQKYLDDPTLANNSQAKAMFRAMVDSYRNGSDPDSIPQKIATIVAQSSKDYGTQALGPVLQAIQQNIWAFGKNHTDQRKPDIAKFVKG